MNAKRILAAFFFVDFAALNAYALWVDGYSGFLTYLSEMGLWGTVLLVDLVIALGMVLIWVWSDAKRTGRNPLGYTLLTVALGSIGTLLYVVMGRGEERDTSARDATALAA